MKRLFLGQRLRLGFALAGLACLLLMASLVASAQASRGPGTDATAARTKTWIICLNASGTRVVLRYRPQLCAHFGPNGAFGGGVNLKGLSWRLWGASTAQANGIECGFHLPCAEVPVQVRAYRISRSCRYRGSRYRIYTRLRATSSFGTTTVRLRACPGRA